jgi:hypothetical protein
MKTPSSLRSETSQPVFWAAVAVAAAAIAVGYVADWLNAGAFAGALALLAAVAIAGRTRR